MHLVEQRRGSAGGDHPPVDLGDLQSGVDRHIDDRQLTGTAQPLEKGAQIGGSVPFHGRSLPAALSATRWKHWRRGQARTRMATKVMSSLGEASPDQLSAINSAGSRAAACRKSSCTAA